MAEVVNIYEAKTHFSRLVERAEQGEPTTIARNGRPVARLCPIAGEREPKVTFGALPGLEIPDDFDAPMPAEVLDAFDGGE